MSGAPRVGVLALQGGVGAHLRLLRGLGVEAAPVRRVEDLVGLGALVLPGGESTTIRRLAAERGFLEALPRRVDEGLAILGTCAGAILLAREVEGHPGFGLGLLDAVVRRNAYGTQRDSFMTTKGAHGRVFIRAPRFLRLGEDVEVLDRLEEGGDPVAVAQGRVLAATYHPELVPDPWLHRELLARVG